MRFSTLSAILCLATCPLLSPFPAVQADDLDTGAKITTISTMTLHEGINILPRYLPNGRDALVFQAWRENGNAHSYTNWLITERHPADSRHTATIISVAESINPVPRDLIYDDPFDRTHIIKTVSFARGTVDGEAASLLLIASRDLHEHDPFTKPTPVTVTVYRLTPSNHRVGHTEFEFIPVSTLLSTRLYCNATLAMSHLLSIPLPPDYVGDRSDGCRPAQPPF